MTTTRTAGATAGPAPLGELPGPCRIGMVGSGFMARFHLEALRSVRDCRLAAVFSPTPAHREAFARDADDSGLGPCRPCSSVEEMVSGGEVDAVWVAGPNDARLPHMEAIAAAAACNGSSLRAVACEKPLGRTVAEARRILRLAQEAGLLHGYLENQVFAPGVRRGRDVLWRRAAATTGRPFLARASEEHSGPHRPWFWDATRQGGGVLLDMMCHSVEVARYLLTEPGAPRASLTPVAVTGHTASLKWSQPRYAEELRARTGGEVDYRSHPAEDLAVGLVELEDSTGRPLLVQATTSWAYVGPGLRIALEVLGPEYSMAFDTLASGLALYLSRGVRGTAGEDLVEKQNAEQGLLPVLEDEAATYGYVAEDRHMVECFRRGEQPEETFADGVEVTSLLMALYRSAELRRRVGMAEEDLEGYVPPVARPEPDGPGS